MQCNERACLLQLRPNAAKLINDFLKRYNQDVDVANRGTNRLHKPEEHMLWNLTDLEPLEKTDEDYKQLIDNLRTYSLLPYYLSSTHHGAAQLELGKVDWDKQSVATRKQYHSPLLLVRLSEALKKLGSKLKQRIRSI